MCIRDSYGTGYIASKKKISVSVPAGIDNGQSIRIRGKGEPGVNGGPRGDLLVEVQVSRHPIFQRQDVDKMCIRDRESCWDIKWDSDTEVCLCG